MSITTIFTTHGLIWQTHLILYNSMGAGWLFKIKQNITARREKVKFANLFQNSFAPVKLNMFLTQSSDCRVCQVADSHFKPTCTRRFI